MTKISKKGFEEKYCKGKGKDGKTGRSFTDHFQGKISDDRYLLLLPFTLNISQCLYDGSCGLVGVAGEFWRLKFGKGNKPIYSYDDASKSIKDGLKKLYKMQDDEIARFVDIFKDVFFDQGTMNEQQLMNVVEPHFFSYVPMKFTAATSDEVKEKYPRKEACRSGQKKIASYCYSIAKEASNSFYERDKNLFCDVISNCLENNAGLSESPDKEEYAILSFVKARFSEDLKWLSSQRSDAIVKYFPLLLHFYTCFSLLQTLIFMNKNNWNLEIDKPKVLFYSLANEKVSGNSESVRKGWSAAENVSDAFLTKLSSYAQALDILNCLFEEEKDLLTYQEIKNRFSQMEFGSEEKLICETILTEYRDRKNDILSERGTEKKFEKIKFDTTVSSFDEFMEKLLDLCIKLQSKDYVRLKRPIDELFKIKLRAQRRNYKVLVLDEELLFFLTAMAVGKDMRIRMDELYRRFRDRYGIEFSYSTREMIVEYLQKLNLIDRKSDSGEAQYVKVVL